MHFADKTKGGYAALMKAAINKAFSTRAITQNQLNNGKVAFEVTQTCLGISYDDPSQITLQKHLQSGSSDVKFLDYRKHPPAAQISWQVNLRASYGQLVGNAWKTQRYQLSEGMFNSINYGTSFSQQLYKMQWSVRGTILSQNSVEQTANGVAWQSLLNGQDAQTNAFAAMLKTLNVPKGSEHQQATRFNLW